MTNVTHKVTDKHNNVSKLHNMYVTLNVMVYVMVHKNRQTIRLLINKN